MKKISFCFLLAVFCSCNKSVPDNHKKLENLADNTCRAIDYRKQRYSVANQIRFAQDTLMQTKSKVDSDRLQKRLQMLSGKKSILLKESLSLADTIRLQLDSLMPYTDKQAQKRFTVSLDSILAKRGCKDGNKEASLN